MSFWEKFRLGYKNDVKERIIVGFRRLIRLTPMQIFRGKMCLNKKEKMPWKIFLENDPLPEGNWEEVRDVWDMMGYSGHTPEKPDLDLIMKIIEELLKEHEIFLDVPTNSRLEIKDPMDFIYVSCRLYQQIHQ